MRINKYVLYQEKTFFLKVQKNLFYLHGPIWDTFIKKILFANFLQIHGPFWDTFIKKIFLADIQKKL